MTTIAALSHGGRVYMGGDSCVAQGESFWLQGQPKVFAIGGVLFGVVGHSSWEAALRSLTWQRPPAGEAWLREELPCRVREALDIGVPEGEPRTESEAVVGYQGRLWFLEGTAALWPVAGTWTAAGCGADAARAVLRYTASRSLRKALKLTPRDRLAAALDAAEALTVGTRRPFRYLAER